MLIGSTVSAEYARIIIDAVATFSILIPKLKEDLNVTAMMELDLFEIKEMVRAYREEYLPWYQELMMIATGLDKKEEEKA